MDAPTVAAPAEKIRPIDPEVQATIEKNDYLKMLNECIPTLKAEHAAAVYMRAFLRNDGDTAVHQRHFMRAAGRITGGMPPMTETALELVRAAKPVYRKR